jgi:hypothetical protein
MNGYGQLYDEFNKPEICLSFPLVMPIATSSSKNFIYFQEETSSNNI